MTKDELITAILETDLKIEEVAAKIDGETYPERVSKLKRYQKELQCIQLWQIEQLKQMKEQLPVIERFGASANDPCTLQ